MDSEETEPMVNEIFDLGQELVPPAHLKVQWSDFSKDLNQIKTNQNKSKQMQNIDVFYRFTSKAYSAATLNSK